VAFEGVEAALPEQYVGGQPAGQIGEALSAEGIQAPLPNDARLHEASFTKDAEVSGGVRLAEACLGHQLPDRPRSADKQVENLAAGWLPDDLEGGGHSIYISI
jgi:hypothetical protein